MPCVKPRTNLSEPRRPRQSPRRRRATPQARRGQLSSSRGSACPCSISSVHGRSRPGGADAKTGGYPSRFHPAVGAMAMQGVSTNCDCRGCFAGRPFMPHGPVAAFAWAFCRDFPGWMAPDRNPGRPRPLQQFAADAGHGRLRSPQEGRWRSWPGLGSLQRFRTNRTDEEADHDRDPIHSISSGSRRHGHRK